MNESMKTNENGPEDFYNLLKVVESKINDENSIKLDDSSRDVSNHVAGYIAHKARKVFDKCCGDVFASTNGQNNRCSSYTSLLSAIFPNLKSCRIPIIL